MQGEPTTDARILIVDDENSNVQFLRRALESEGYSRIEHVTDPRAALDAYSRFRPDLILLDLVMPHLDGFQLLESLRPLTTGDYVPILVLTADNSADSRRRALAGGAKDFLNKPFAMADARLRIRNLLETRILHLELKKSNELLEERVRLRTEELEEARIEVLERLARAAEYRDDATGQHTQRVGCLAAMLAAALDRPEPEVELIRRAAPLHDVGKIGIPDAVLLKEGRLSPVEFELMKTHTTIGASILSGSRVPLLQVGQQIALTHHERWDGQGYPQGLSGTAIPLVGRIVTVADVFDSLTHERPYKPSWSVDEAVAELESERGRHFDGRVVDAFVELFRAGELADIEPALAGAAIAETNGHPGGIP